MSAKLSKRKQSSMDMEQQENGMLQGNDLSNGISQTFEVYAEFDGIRLDKFLAMIYPTLGLNK